MSDPGVECGRCGAGNAAGAIVCARCGAVLAAYAPPPGARPPADGAPTVASPVSVPAAPTPTTAPPPVPVPSATDAGAETPAATSADSAAVDDADAVADAAADLPVDREGASFGEPAAAALVPAVPTVPEGIGSEAATSEGRMGERPAEPGAIPVTPPVAVERPVVEVLPPPAVVPASRPRRSDLWRLTVQPPATTRPAATVNAALAPLDAWLAERIPDPLQRATSLLFGAVVLAIFGAAWDLPCLFGLVSTWLAPAGMIVWAVWLFRGGAARHG